MGLGLGLLLVPPTQLLNIAYKKDLTMEKEIEQIKKDIRDIRENHLAHIERDIAKIFTNQGWLMKFFWIITTASIGTLITVIISAWLK